jgi:ADP-ribose pyrophosphatase YjhB (NUDIX family)
MSNTPLPIVLSIVTKDNRILMVKRSKGAYIGLWGLPGGKIELNEHISQAAIREVGEECGLHTHFRRYIGTVSEHLVENKKKISHFIIHICELRLKTSTLISTPEHESKWFDLKMINEMKQKIIPSDIIIIEKMYQKKIKSYFNFILEKIGDIHILRRTE